MMFQLRSTYLFDIRQELALGALVELLIGKHLLDRCLELGLDLVQLGLLGGRFVTELGLQAI
jgi:hypothetical protein